MTEEDFDSADDFKGAYAESRLIKNSIIYKKNEILYLLEKKHYYDNFETYPAELMPKITSNLITFYGLIRPMLTPKKPNKKYDEYKNKIKPIMTKLIKDKTYQIEDDKLYDVFDEMVDFIHLVGITDLTVKDDYQGGQETIKY